MRKARFISPTADTDPSIYHIHSRCVDRVFKLSGVEVAPDGQKVVIGDDGGQARSVFVRILHDYAEFLGCSVNAFCVMSNHFHILLEVPPKKKGEAVSISDDEFLEKIERMYALEYYRDVKEMLERFREGNLDQSAEDLKARYTCRMYDLSEFMKGVKQRFTQWYNREHQRTGTLWEGRFKSVLVEGGYASRVVSAYIDLNPVRAGIVERPEDYRWSSYGVAMNPALGEKNSSLRDWAREGLCRVMKLHRKSGSESGILPDGFSVMWERQKNKEKEISGSEWYRMMLYADGEEVFISKPQIGVDKVRVRVGFKREEVVKVLERGGKLSFGEALRCRIRYLTDGLVFGRQSFVNAIFHLTRSYFSEGRKSGARPIREIGWKEAKEDRLYSMRALKKEVFK